ncbi:hypothetical protein [Cryobacterium sp. Y29]|uniref:hypothetical protein n=1 Tax=Cryobacterium sp. Y29 TaxID=2048285 RepID=UPI0011B0853E|nr:hypothetical protein [Cryobacterium sp. Y29]
MRNRVSAAALVLVVAGLSGCSGVSAPRIPPTELGSKNLGLNAEVGPVEVRNLLLVTHGEAEPADVTVTAGTNTEALESPRATSRAPLGCAVHGQRRSRRTNPPFQILVVLASHGPSSPISL